MSSHRRRAIRGLAGLSAAALLMGACGSSSSHTSSASPKNISGQTITYWATLQGTGAGQTTSTLKAAFKVFTKQTGVHVNLQVIPWTTQQTRVLNAVTSGTGADVMEIGNTQAPSFAATGGFLSFTPSVLKQIGGASKFVPSAMSETGLAGKTPMSVPVYSESYELAYNKADFAAAHLSGPPTTWTQFLSDAKKLTGHGRYGFALDGSSDNAVDAAHWAFFLGEQAGSPLYTSAGKPDFANAKEANVLKIYLGLLGSDHIANPSDAQSGTQPGNLFADNKAAMVIGQAIPGSLNQLGMKPSQYGIAQVPVLSPLPTGGQAIESHVAGINLAVRSSTKHLGAALALVKFMTSVPEQVSINKTYGSLPAVTAAYNNPTFQTASDKVMEGILLHHSMSMPRFASESQMETDLGGALTKLNAQAATSGKTPSTQQILSALNSAQQQLVASSSAK